MNDKLPLILVPSSLNSDELVGFIRLIVNNKFPFARLVVCNHGHVELIISDKERYKSLDSVKEYLRERCGSAPRNISPLGYVAAQPEIKNQ